MAFAEWHSSLVAAKAPAPSSATGCLRKPKDLNEFSEIVRSICVLAIAGYLPSKLYDRYHFKWTDYLEKRNLLLIFAHQVSRFSTIAIMKIKKDRFVVCSELVYRHKRRSSEIGTCSYTPPCNTHLQLHTSMQYTLAATHLHAIHTCNYTPPCNTHLQLHTSMQYTLLATRAGPSRCGAQCKT